MRNRFRSFVSNSFRNWAFFFPLLPSFESNLWSLVSIIDDRRISIMLDGILFFFLHVVDIPDEY